MARTILGVDIGYGSVKLALVKGGALRRTVDVPLPKNLMREGRITSPEAMGELLSTAMSEHRIRASEAAIVLPDETAFVRTVVMPKMSADQLTYNLPYEFKDYITGELKNFAFDYAMFPSSGEDGDTMELMAAAVPMSVIEEYRAILRKAGLKMVVAAPAVCSYVPLIRNLERGNTDEPNEYCILDLGYRAIRMHMFRGEQYIVSRVLELGLSDLDSVVADIFNVDIHLAHTYLLTDHENCQRHDRCLAAYNSIAVELMRALNFYRFSNPDAALSDVWLCGGGAAIEPLSAAIAETLDMRIHTADELLAQADAPADFHAFVQTVGVTLTNSGR